MARIAISGRRAPAPAKSKLSKARLEELLPGYERVQARDLLKGDLIEPNEISGSLRVIGPARLNGREVILAKTDDTLAREFFLPSTAIVRLLVQGRSAKR
jgi:hypothetical protein